MRSQCAEANKRSLRSQQEALQDEVVVAGEQRDRAWGLLQHCLRLQEFQSVEGGLLEGDHRLDPHQPGQCFRGEEAPPQRWLELEEDEGDVHRLGDSGVVTVGHLLIEGRALEGRDGEYQQRIGSGGLGLASQLHRLGSVGGDEPGDDGHLPSHLCSDDLQHPHSFRRREVRTFACIHVDGHPYHSLLHHPVDVAPEPRLVNPVVLGHGKDRSRDDASKIKF